MLAGQRPPSDDTFTVAPVEKTDKLVVLDKGKGFFLLTVTSETITSEEGVRLENGGVTV